MNGQTASVTFSERVENGPGMQITGEECATGFRAGDIDNAEQFAKKHSLAYLRQDLVTLLPEEDREHPSVGQFGSAEFILIRGGVEALLQCGHLDRPAEHPSTIEREVDEEKEEEEEEKKQPQSLIEQLATVIFALEVDKKAVMRGTVKHKLARWNATFGEQAQEPDIANKRGTIYAFDDLPLLQTLRANLSEEFGESCSDLLAELNIYYDIMKCGIGFHGDGERLKVLCARFGKALSLDFQWYANSSPVGERFSVVVNGGDLYMMSQKATGNDWKKTKGGYLSLRHAAGCAKYRPSNESILKKLQTKKRKREDQKEEEKTDGKCFKSTK